MVGIPCLFSVLQFDPLYLRLSNSRSDGRYLFERRTRFSLSRRRLACSRPKQRRSASRKTQRASWERHRDGDVSSEQTSLLRRLDGRQQQRERWNGGREDVSLARLGTTPQRERLAAFLETTSEKIRLLHTGGRRRPAKRVWSLTTLRGQKARHGNRR